MFANLEARHLQKMPESEEEMTNITKGVELSRAATRGAWIYEKDVHHGNEFGTKDEVLGRVFTGNNMNEDTAFIAYHNPDYMLQLYEELQELRKDRERLEWLIDSAIEVIPASSGGNYFALKNPFSPSKYMVTPIEAIDAAMEQEKKA